MIHQLKLSKIQLSEMIQSGGILGEIGLTVAEAIIRAGFERSKIYII